MKLALRHSIGRRAFRLRSELLADGTPVGTVFAYHAVAWGDARSDYTFQPNEAGKALGLAATTQSTQRELLARLKETQSAK